MFVNPKKGFTLIELLVTISIIAVLSIVGLVVYQGVTTKARDSTRKNDLNKLATALEIYYQANSKYIVNTNGTDLTSCHTDPNPQTNSFYSAIRANMSDGVVPTDPSTRQAYCYLSSNSGQSYTLCAKLDNTSDPDIASNPAPTACTTAGYNYGLVPK